MSYMTLRQELVELLHGNPAGSGIAHSGASCPELVDAIIERVAARVNGMIWPHETSWEFDQAVERAVDLIEERGDDG